MLVEEVLPPRTGLVHQAMRALRPHWDDEAAFAERVDAVQRPQGYRLAGAFTTPDEPAVAVAGFRLIENLFSGRIVYVDDLSTLPEARGQGAATALLQWVFAEAERLGCAAVDLDSGVGPARATAHRLYLNAGFTIVSHHFARPLTGDGNG